jgi:hypothetical protein
MSPIPVTDPQFLAICNAATALCPSDRDQFIAQVHAALRGQPIGDGSIGRAIRAVQASFPHPVSDHRQEPHVRPRARAFVK